MRKEGVAFLVVSTTLLLGIANYYFFFNAFASFFLAGVVPGLPLRLPSLLMLALSLGALFAIVAWPLRGNLAKYWRMRSIRSGQPSA